MNEVAYQGPKRGADRAVLLAHGAGADMHAAALTTVADALAAAKIPSLRFNFPYKAAGRRSPDRPPVLEAAVRDAAQELAARAKVPVDRIVLGGRSMGGRIGSLVAAQDGALGVALLGYPLHPPGKPGQLRVEHFPKLTMPVLFVSGTRDAFGTPDELTQHATSITGRVTFSWIETGDHGFKPLKSSGLTPAVVLAGAAGAVVDFVASLPSQT
jgi:predicted alpha/beta-hydrolase family hydrolase